MKSLIGLLLALSLVLSACSAENSSSATTEPVVNAEPGELVKAAPGTAAANPEMPPAPVVETAPGAAIVEAPAVLAQAGQPAPTPMTAPPARSDIVAGKDYRVLTPTQPTSSSPDKVEVAEFFMYSCPHCKDLEPFVSNYLQQKPNYVSFIRIPANFSEMARMHSKIFYVAETLGVLDKVHAEIFREFHTKRNKLDNEKAIIEFFVGQGVAEDEVVSAYNSFPVDTKVRQAGNLGRRYGIDSVPAFVINGKYVTSASMTGSTKKLREVMDYLAAKEAAHL